MKTADEMLTEFDATLLNNPKRSTGDLLLELDLIDKAIDEAKATAVMSVRLSIMTKALQCEPNADPSFDELDQAVARLKKLKGIKHPPGRPRISGGR